MSAEDSDKPTPREELEQQVIALIMGELDAEETAAIEGEMAKSEFLQEFHRRMQATLGFVQEAMDTVEVEKTPAPLRLSDERREALFEKLKVVELAKVDEYRSRWNRKWLTGTAVAAGLVLLIGLSVEFASHHVSFRDQMAAVSSIAPVPKPPPMGAETNEFFSAIHGSRASRELSDLDVFAPAVSPIPPQRTVSPGHDLSGGALPEKSESTVSGEQAVALHETVVAPIRLSIKDSGVTASSVDAGVKSRDYGAIVLPDVPKDLEEQIERGRMLAKVDDTSSNVNRQRMREYGIAGEAGGNAKNFGFQFGNALEREEQELKRLSREQFNRNSTWGVEKERDFKTVAPANQPIATDDDALQSSGQVPSKGQVALGVDFSTPATPPAPVIAGGTRVRVEDREVSGVTFAGKAFQWRRDLGGDQSGQAAASAGSGAQRSSSMDGESKVESMLTFGDNWEKPTGGTERGFNARFDDLGHREAGQGIAGGLRGAVVKSEMSSPDAMPLAVKPPAQDRYGEGYRSKRVGGSQPAVRSLELMRLSEGETKARVGEVLARESAPLGEPSSGPAPALAKKLSEVRRQTARQESLKQLNDAQVKQAQVGKELEVAYRLGDLRSSESEIKEEQEMLTTRLRREKAALGQEVETLRKVPAMLGKTRGIASEESRHMLVPSQPSSLSTARTTADRAKKKISGGSEKRNVELRTSVDGLMADVDISELVKKENAEALFFDTDPAPREAGVAGQHFGRADAEWTDRNGVAATPTPVSGSESARLKRPAFMVSVNGSGVMPEQQVAQGARFRDGSSSGQQQQGQVEDESRSRSWALNLGESQPAAGRGRSRSLQEGNVRFAKIPPTGALFDSRGGRAAQQAGGQSQPQATDEKAHWAYRDNDGDGMASGDGGNQSRTVDELEDLFVRSEFEAKKPADKKKSMPARADGFAAYAGFGGSGGGGGGGGIGGGAAVDAQALVEMSDFITVPNYAVTAGNAGAEGGELGAAAADAKTVNRRYFQSLGTRVDPAGMNVGGYDEPGAPMAAPALPQVTTATAAAPAEEAPAAPTKGPDGKPIVTGMALYGSLDTGNRGGVVVVDALGQAIADDFGLQVQPDSKAKGMTALNSLAAIPVPTSVAPAAPAEVPPVTYSFQSGVEKAKGERVSGRQNFMKMRANVRAARPALPAAQAPTEFNVTVRSTEERSAKETMDFDGAAGQKVIVGGAFNDFEGLNEQIAKLNKSGRVEVTRSRGLAKPVTIARTNGIVDELAADLVAPGTYMLSQTAPAKPKFDSSHKLFRPRVANETIATAGVNELSEQLVESEGESVSTRQIMPPVAAVGTSRKKIATKYDPAHLSAVKQEIAEIEKLKTKLHSNRNLSRADRLSIYASIVDEEFLASVPAAGRVDSKRWKELDRDRSNLEKQIQEAGKVWLDKHPKMQELRRQFRTVDEQMEKEIYKSAYLFSLRESRLRDQQRQLEALKAKGKKTAPTEPVPPMAPKVKPKKPKTLKPKPEITTKENAFSTFSLNVSDVAFKLAVASLDQGKLPEPDTVRSEEFVNALDYHDPAPRGNERLAFAWEQARNPFTHNRDLLRFSVQTAARGRETGQPLNLVVLLDSSGSMERADRVKIVREMLAVLAGQLKKSDKISVIAFARTPWLLVDGMAGGKPGDLLNRILNVTPQGGTNLEVGLDTAYSIAQRHYLAKGNNRVIVLTDGAANLGNIDPEQLKAKVESFRKKNIALDCFGVGWEGYNDTLLESLSRNGDGRYGFINNPEDARNGFANLLAGALQVAAANVKVQIEFNPERVTSYRQIGYDKHQLTKEQFRDNTVDAAEIGAAESGTAMYSVQVNREGKGGLGVVRVRYKIPATGRYVEESWNLEYDAASKPMEQAKSSMRLASVAVSFAEWLAANPHAGNVNLGDLQRYLTGVPEEFSSDERPKQLARMIQQARQISGE